MATALVSGTDSVLAALRAATSDARMELVKNLDLPAVTRARYEVFLGASIAVVAPLEARIACWLGLPSDGLCRTSALRSDLAALGTRKAYPATVPPIHSLAEAMGAAYVVEGSALDGVKHATTIARRLGADVPKRFLSLRGEKTGERWRQFVLSLEHWGAHATRHSRMAACESARATFAAYASTFAAVGAFAT